MDFYDMTLEEKIEHDDRGLEMLDDYEPKCHGCNDSGYLYGSEEHCTCANGWIMFIQDNEKLVEQLVWRVQHLLDGIKSARAEQEKREWQEEVKRRLEDGEAPF